jgi:starch synthase
MDKKRILYVSQEISPYLNETEISKVALTLPKKMNDKGHEVRVFMPRFGVINERRHQLHEVIRLSGINIVVNDMDQPLIIKVASVPGARIQVYFIDNEEYFKRKSVFFDDKGNFHQDNDERSLFFSRGVIETVKKLGWAPDIIHVHGWMGSLLPLYLKKFHADDPLFADTKIVSSIYGFDYCEPFSDKLKKGLEFDGVNGQDIHHFDNADVDCLNKAGVLYSDAVMKHSGVEGELAALISEKHPHALSVNDVTEEIADVERYYEQVLAEAVAVAD